MVERCAERVGLTRGAGRDFERVNPEPDARFRDGSGSRRELVRRCGVTPNLARAVRRTDTTAIAAVTVQRSEAGGPIRVAVGRHPRLRDDLRQVPSNDELHPAGAPSLVILDRGPLLVAGTRVNLEPDARALADIALAAAPHARRLGIEPKVALRPGSRFGDLDGRSGRVAREAPAIRPDRECGGEPRTLAALDPGQRERLEGRAKVPVRADPDAAGATRTIPKSVAGGPGVGLARMGMGDRAPIVTPCVTVRGLVGIAAPASVHG